MSLKRNVVANFLGSGWTALMGVVFLPSYLKALGAESYGLVGVYAVMLAWISMLDLGMTPTLNREMARLRAGLHTPTSIRDLLRSIELVFLCLSTLMVLLIWFGAAPLADHWLQARHLPRPILIQSLQIIGLVLASRWLVDIYSAALIGMQDQVAMNMILSLGATLRWGGAFVVVTFLAPSILAFFIWQGIAAFITVVLLMMRTYWMLPKAERSGRPNFESLKEIRSFASGMFLTSVLAFLLTQTDKIVISKMLPMDQLGYYMLAASASGALLLIATPINNAIYPRLTELVALGDKVKLEHTYRFSCELMSAILIPAGLTLGILGRQVLMVWTGDSRMTTLVAPILSLLAFGTMFNGLMNIPYMLQLAHGWTSLSVSINALSVLIIVPVMFVAVNHFGMTGAASAWMILNVVSLMVSAHFMYARIVPAVKGYWYRHVILMPLIAAVLFLIVFSRLFPKLPTRGEALVELILCVPLMLAMMLGVLPNLRSHAYGWWKRAAVGSLAVALVVTSLFVNF